MNVIMNRRDFIKISMDAVKGLVLSPFLFSTKNIFAQDIAPPDMLTSASLEEMAGQMLMVGIKGDWGARNPGVLKWIAPGAVILYQHNVVSKTQLKNLTRDINNYLKDRGAAPAFIAIDHEGGRVNRLPHNEFTAFSPNAHYGKKGDVKAVEKEAQIMAQQLLEVGITMNLAPVVDVVTNPKNVDIGNRSYSAKPETVTQLAKIFIEMSIKSGMFVTAKHFPGYGPIAKNPHKDLPIVKIPREKWEKVHLPPFEEVIKINVPAIMTGHVIYTELQAAKQKVAATLSQEIITGILREKLQYQGLIMTDDLEMGAIIKSYSPEKSAYAAVMAGNEMLLYCHSANAQRKAFRSLVNRAKDDENLRAKVVSAYGKIKVLKTAYGII